MELANNQGWIQGKEMKTMGNLGVEPRTIYGYRNIPYAKQPSLINNDVLRFQVIFSTQLLSIIQNKINIIFQQPKPNNVSLGTQNRPYDAGPTGPLCPQLGVVTQPIITAVAILPIQSTIEIVLKQILPVSMIAI